ncbi:MAG: nucleobase:cation symporter, family [Pseudonocardiales bacterium]|jgi:putative hydroxymethylpyrimidine transporter CytX|nr:nucleobase:cation symporter, family [Pseudonocardiales bacterium]
MTVLDDTVRVVPENEPGRTLADRQPRTLGVFDMVALWGNLGVSLLGPTAALFVLAPTGVNMSLAAAFTAVVLGSVIGTIPVALSAMAGTETGSPAMVLLRGLFGARVSYVPTILNLLQCLGWGIFELVVIATAAEQLLPWHVRWAYIVLAGVLTTLMSLRPLGVVRTLRKYALVAVLLSSVYFLVQFAREPLPSLTAGGWSGFWLATDAVMAVSISWVPLAADYTRHARSGRAAFSGSLLGYSLTQIAYYALGLLAFSTVVHGDDPSHSPLFSAFIALPLGWLPFAILVLRELDESFTNVYSTVVSVQNLRPLADRRVLALVIGTVATLGALALGIGDYQNFLYLIGSVFIPMSAVFIVDFFVLGRGRRWDTSESAPARWLMLLPWALGFCAYQLINPGYISWWSKGWTHVDSWLHFTPATWMSASLLSFLVAAVATLPAALVRPRTKEPAC